MTYSKREFAKDLKSQLNLGYEPKRIGSWAHKMYLQHCGRIDRELEEIMVDLFVLEEGPEFEYPESKLRELIKSLEDWKIELSMKPPDRNKNIRIVRQETKDGINIQYIFDNKWSFILINKKWKISLKDIKTIFWFFNQKKKITRRIRFLGPLCPKHSD